jgi:hypothetical protein
LRIEDFLQQFLTAHCTGTSFHILAIREFFIKGFQCGILKPCDSSWQRKRWREVVVMRGDLFKGVDQEEFDLHGQKGKLPVFYYDNTSLTAFFTASTEKVRAFLPHPEMRPIELFPGRCLMAFMAFEYRKSDLGPYNEFCIGVGITFRKSQIPLATITSQLLRRSLSAYIWHLPVTTEIARIGGVDLYGYPKFIADIDFHREPGRIRCDLSDQGRKILSLSGETLATGVGKRLEYTTYSIKGGDPLRTRILVNPIEFSQSMSRDAARLEIGTEHPICEELKGIGLSEKPILYQYSPVTEAILFAGNNTTDG